MNLKRLSYTEQLYRDIHRIPAVTAYNEMAELIGKGRKAGLVPKLYEVHGDTETPKWMVMDMFFHGPTPYYWLVSFDEDHVVSFPAVASSDEALPKCFTVKFVKRPGTDLIAHPEDVRARVKRKPEILSYSTHAINHKTAKWWTSISKRANPNIYGNIPLGKLYRAIDVGSLVPIFRMKDKLIGLVVK